MQNKLTIWRAANPIFLICCYFLFGFLLYKSTKYYWPKLEQPALLLAIGCLCIALYLSFFFQHKVKWAGCIPTLIVILWGVSVSQFEDTSSFFSKMVSAKWVIETRVYFISKIDRSFTNPESGRFAKSLLFGTKTDMSQPLKNAYQQLGILHIIAISGMHLDILFKLLEKLTAWLPNKIWASWTKLISLLLIVWTYTFIAHAGPSVVRASLFFSMLLIGRFFYLNIFSLNTISTGILLVLLYNGQLITEIGLQLSYAAVLGIHFFYKPLLQLVPMDNQLLQIAWSNLALSMAAQLTTLPILLYYFHTSSSLSIIGNFLFVPASSILLYALLGFIILPDFGGIQGMIAKGISWYIEMMQQSIGGVFQFLQIEDRTYNLGIAGLLFYYFCLFVGLKWLQKKDPTSLMLLLTGSCIYSFIKLFSL